MAYRDSSTQLHSRVLALEAMLEGLRSRFDALETTVSRLEVNVAMGPVAAPSPDPEAAELSDEPRDKKLADWVGHLALRVAALERNLQVAPPARRSRDDVRALVEAELPPKRRR